MIIPYLDLDNTGKIFGLFFAVKGNKQRMLRATAVWPWILSRRSCRCEKDTNVGHVEDNWTFEFLGLMGGFLHLPPEQICWLLLFPHFLRLPSFS